MNPSRRYAMPLAVLVLLLCAEAATAWGKNGHRVIAEVAERRLSPAARSAIDEYMGSKVLAQIGTWADFVRSERGWDFAGPWHYISVEDDKALEGVIEGSQETPLPDHVVEAVEYLAQVLRGSEAEVEHFTALLEREGADRLLGSVEATALALLVHMVADVHQPLHVGRTGDRGANQIRVNWFDELSNLHSVWDSDMIEHLQLSYTELTDFIEQEYEGRDGEWAGGPAADWAAESRRLRYEVYEIWSRTDRTNHLPDLGWEYVHSHIGTVKQRLYQGGVRLAALLNSIYE